MKEIPGNLLGGRAIDARVEDASGEVKARSFQQAGSRVNPILRLAMPLIKIPIRRTRIRASHFPVIRPVRFRWSMERETE